MKTYTLIFAAIILMISCSQNQIAYIDVGILMQDYEGLKAFDEKMEAERDKLRKEIESLIEPYQVKVDEYYKNVGKMSATARTETEQALQQEQAAIQDQQDKFKEQLEKQRLEALEAINEEIALFVEGYAESQGLKLVLGTSGTATVIYGEEKLDITQEVLTELNRLFLEEKK